MINELNKQLNEEQKDILKHALGLNYKKQPCRNYYCCYLSDDLKFLVKNGYMICRTSEYIPENTFYFFVTPKGIDAVNGNGYSKRNKKSLINTKILSVSSKWDY